MNILITGGCGFIGSNLVDYLSFDHNITVIDNLSTGKIVNENVKNYFLDIRSPEILELKEKFDIIVHLAALPRINPSYNRLNETIDVNSNGVLNILNLSKKNNCKLIYASTSSIYNDIYNNPYTYSKYLGEKHCELFKNLYGLDVTICRFFNVYGKNQVRIGENATLMGIFEEQYIKKQNLTIKGTGNQRRDFINVLDICSAIKLLLEQENSEIINIGTGINYSINEIAEMFGGKVTHIPSNNVFDERNTQADINLKGWKPKINIKDYINLFKISI